MCDIGEEELVPQKKRVPEGVQEPSKKKETTTIEEDTSNIINVKCGDLSKSADKNTYTYNLNVPKNASIVIINIKKRNSKTTQLVLNLEKPQLVHKSETEIIVSNN